MLPLSGSLSVCLHGCVHTCVSALCVVFLSYDGTFLSAQLCRQVRDFGVDEVHIYCYYFSSAAIKGVHYKDNFTPEQNLKGTFGHLDNSVVNRNE